MADAIHETFPIYQDLHDARVPIRKASLSANVSQRPNREICDAGRTLRDIGCGQVWLCTAGRPKGTGPPLMRNFRLVIGRGELSRLWSSRGVEEGLRPKYDGGRGRGG